MGRLEVVLRRMDTRGLCYEKNPAIHSDWLNATQLHPIDDWIAWEPPLASWIFEYLHQLNDVRYKEREKEEEEISTLREPISIA